MAAKKLTCEAARQIDLVDFLSGLGYELVFFPAQGGENGFI